MVVRSGCMFDFAMKRSHCRAEITFREETNRRIVDIIGDVSAVLGTSQGNILPVDLPKERTFVAGSPMAMYNNLAEVRLE